MPCYHPILAYRSREVLPSGKRGIVFNPNDGYSDLKVTLPCGQCIGCRLERSRQWAIRCVHESQLHEQNCFITLTFNQANLNSEGSLVKADFQNFMKRLRRWAEPDKIRYFHCGEYGEISQRPHHHAILFGIDFPDKQLLQSERDVSLYTSPALDALWGLGLASIGEVTFESSAYVARYCTKKITGSAAEKAYRDRIPPYNTMSRKPGIASRWYDKYQRDVFPADNVVIRPDVICTPPKFYDKLLEQTEPKEYKKIKSRRMAGADRRKDDNSLERLAVKEELKINQLEKCKRII